MSAGGELTLESALASVMAPRRVQGASAVGGCVAQIPAPAPSVVSADELTV